MTDAPAFNKKLNELNRANDRVTKAQTCIELLEKFQKHTVQGVTSKSSRFWEEVTFYQLADALSKFAGCDTFEDMQQAAFDELWSEHSYDIREEMYLDDEGFAKSSFRVTQGMGGRT